MLRALAVNLSTAYIDLSTAFKNSTRFLMVPSSEEAAFSQAVRALIPKSLACNENKNLFNAQKKSIPRDGNYDIQSEIFNSFRLKEGL